jgi:hypothetical protein
MHRTNRRKFLGYLSAAPTFNASYGAGRAAELSGDRHKAHERYAELLQICGQSDSARLEIQNATAFLQSR